MTKQQKIIGASIGVLFVLALTTGYLWSLLRICVSGAAVAALASTCYFAVKRCRNYQKRDSSDNIPNEESAPLIATSAATLFFFAVLGLMPNAADTKPPASPSDSNAMADSASGRPARESPVVQPEPDEDVGDDAAAELFNALMGAAIQEDQRQRSDPRYQRFSQSLEAAQRCPRCGGAGSYSYVDGNGLLQSNQCPSCLGSGRNLYR